LCFVNPARKSQRVSAINPEAPIAMNILLQNKTSDYLGNPFHRKLDLVALSENDLHIGDEQSDDESVLCN
jgi:hypothetical protein